MPTGTALRNTVHPCVTITLVHKSVSLQFDREMTTWKVSDVLHAYNYNKYVKCKPMVSGLFSDTLILWIHYDSCTVYVDTALVGNTYSDGPHQNSFSARTCVSLV